MEENPREIELNFDNGSEAQIEELESVRDELSEAIACDEANVSGEDGYRDSDSDYATGQFEEPERGLYREDELYGECVPPEENDSASAAERIDTEMLLRSRQPMNRPAGTPPLNSFSGESQASALEKAVAGKSYGTALRILREQSNMTYEELENITRIQPRFIKALEEEKSDNEQQPLVFQIGSIRTLCRVYGVSQSTSDLMVAKLKEKLEYTSPPGLMDTVDVDSSGQRENDEKLKKIIWVGGAIGAAVLALIILIIVMVSSCSAPSEAPAEDSGSGKIENTDAGSFDPENIRPLLKEYKLEIQKLPLAK